jgi:pteridine reductase
VASPHLDPERARAYAEHRYRFPAAALRGRTILLAGGTGGLGPALASLLLAEGARVVLGFRGNRSRAEAVAADLNAATGRTPELAQGDLSEPAGRARLLGAAGSELYGLVVFSGDPARITSAGPSDATLLGSVAANFAGPVLLAQAAIEGMAARGIAGSVVLLSTMQAVHPFAGSLNYAGPKSALLQAAKILAKERRGAGIRVNVIAPGVTMVGMAESSIARGKYDPYLEQGAIPRFGYPEDIARAARLLLEPDNFITGQVLVVDGGLTL